MLSALLAQLSFVHDVLCLVNPLYPLMGCLNCITKVGLVTRWSVLHHQRGRTLQPDPPRSLSSHLTLAFLGLQVSFHPSLYDETFFWKNLLIAVISVRTCQHCRRTEAVVVCVVCSN